MLASAGLAGVGPAGAAVAEVEALLTEVESLIVGAGQVQTIHTTEIQPCVVAWVGGRQTNLLCSKPDVKLVKCAHGVSQRGLKVGKARKSVTIGHGGK